MDLPISLTSAGSINTTVESKIGWEPGRGGREGGGGGGDGRREREKKGEREEVLQVKTFAPKWYFL